MGELADHYIDRMTSGHWSVGKLQQKEQGVEVKMNQMSTSVTTGEVRLNFVNLFQPRAQHEGAEPKYSVTILLPKSDTATKQRIDAAIQAAYERGVIEKWNGARPPLKHTIHDGDGVRPSGDPFGPECKGHWVFTATSKQKPEVVDANLNPILDQSVVYDGVYGRVNLNFFAYSNSGNRGVSAGLGPVQILRDGEPLGRVTAADVFGAAPAPVQPSGQAPQTPQQGYTPQQFWGQVPGGQQTPQQPTQGYGVPQQQPQQAPQQQPQQIDPITGQPLGGGVYGI